MASKLQLSVGDKVEIWNSAYYASVAALGTVTKLSATGVATVVVDELVTSKILRVGQTLSFNANHWNDMIICQQRGMSTGTGFTARPASAVLA